MKKSFLLLLLCLFLSNCTNEKTANDVSNSEKTPKAVDPDLEKINSILKIPYRNINNFNIKTGNNFIDSLNTVLKNQKSVKTTVTKDLCLGDNCESYLTMVDEANGTVFYFSKGDSYDYGFSNDQYFLKNDSIYYVRNFNVNIETEPTDSTDTIWRIEELTFKFQQNSVISCKRTALTKDLSNFNFKLKGVNCSLVKVTFKNTYQDKKKELQELLTMKDSEFLD